MSEAEALSNVALGHLQEERFAEAAATLEPLLAAEPERGEDWLKLAYALYRLRRFDAALDAYQKAIDTGGGRPEDIRLDRAAIFAQQLGNPAAAKRELEAALAIDSDSFRALAHLGKVGEDLGDRAAARAAYERAQAIRPDDVYVLTRIAALTDFTDAHDPLIGRLRELVAEPRHAPGARASAGFALGAALDSLGRYDDAFAAYRAANDAAQAERRGVTYRPELEARFTAQIMAAFASPEPRAATAGEEKPIFVCGMFRSGSTLAERILARHSRVTPGGELELMLAIVETGFATYPEGAASAGGERIAELREQYLSALETIRPGADLVTDKQTFNFRHIGLIKRLFPGARIVDTVRNPLDNGLAMYFAHLAPEASFATDLHHIVHWYRDYRRIMAHWQRLYPDSIHTLDYDALVADPEPSIRALVGFCGLDWQDACLEPHKADTAVSTASAWQVRQPLYTRSSGRWRNYERHIGPLIEAFPPE